MNRRISLFETIRQQLGSDVDIIRATKATLVHLSHTLEEIVLNKNLPAMIFTGFQSSSYWRQETARYRQLASVVKQVTIFAGEPLPEDSNASWLHIQLLKGDPLRQEWFVVILSTEFSAVLCGLDTLKPVANEAQREFETIFTFDPSTIERVLDYLEDAVTAYYPDKLAGLQEARREFPVIQMSPTLMSSVMSDIITFEEGLHTALLQSVLEKDRVNAELRQQRDFNQQLVELSPAFYLTVSPDLRVIMMNSAMLEAVGVPSEDAVGSHFNEYVSVESWQDTAQHLQQLTSPNSLTVFENTVVTAEDDTIAVEWHAKPIFDQAGSLEFYFCIGIDITEREKSRQQTIELALERERARMLADFVRDMSHDFKTPLTIMNTSVYLAGKATDAERRARHLKVLEEQTAHLNKLVESLLMLSRLELAPKLEIEEVNISDIVGEVLVDFGPVAEVKSVQLVHRTLAPPSTVRGNLTELRRVLLNLLENAVRYTPEGGIVTVLLDRDAEAVIISVRDTGVGIDEKDLPRIFNRFYRADEARSIETGGAGLGLAIVKKIVERHGGEITVESRLGEGSTFRIRLPYITGESA